MKQKRISEIVVTRLAPIDPDAQIVDAETGGEVVAIVSAESVVTLDGYQVKVVELEEAAPDIADDMEWQEILVDEEAAYKQIVERMAEVGIPLDKEVIELVVDAYHDCLEEQGIAQFGEQQDDDDQ